MNYRCLRFSHLTHFFWSLNYSLKGSHNIFPIEKLLFFFLHFYVFLFLLYFFSFTVSFLILPFSFISFQHGFFPSSFPLPVPYSNVFGQSKLWKLFLIHRTRLCPTPRIISTKHLSEGRYLFFFIFAVDGGLVLKHEFFSVILWDIRYRFYGTR